MADLVEDVLLERVRSAASGLGPPALAAMAAMDRADRGRRCEGMVVKPVANLVHGRTELVQPGLKVR